MNWIAWIFVGVQFILLFVLFRIVIRLVLFILFFHESLPYAPSNWVPQRAIARLPVLDGRKKIVDLGSGTGELLLAIGKRHRAAELVGVEHNRALNFFARARFFFWRKKGRPTIITGDMFAYSLQNVDAVVGYWIQVVMPQLLEKFAKELRPGAVVICHTFPLPDHPAFSKQEINIPYSKKQIWIYTKCSL
ncbi:MAG: class I SAM-dependent methyltransferase [Candidatus Kerfeldbacteria bacterium]|nr:class I SAM-dependent methyltransferase [Candidatus Kerfeldbacteria bacterium]